MSATLILNEESPKTANIHLGSLEEIGCTGVPIQVAADIMRSWQRVVAKRCRTCNRKLVATVGDGTTRPRRRAKCDGQFSLCDDDYVAATVKSMPPEDQARIAGTGSERPTT